MAKLTEQQKLNLAYYKKHLSEFLEDELLNGKFVIIAGEKLRKSFDTLDLAIDYAINNLRVGEYIVQQVINEDEIVSFLKAAIA